MSEPSHDTLQFDSIDQEHCYRSFILPDVVQKDVLHVLRFFGRHFSPPQSFYGTPMTYRRFCCRALLCMGSLLLLCILFRFRDWMLQGLEELAKVLAIRKMRGWWMIGKLTGLRRCFSHQNRAASPGVRAFHVDVRITDEPDVCGVYRLVRLKTGGRQSHPDRFDGRFYPDPRPRHQSRHRNNLTSSGPPPLSEGSGLFYC